MGVLVSDAFTEATDIVLESHTPSPTGTSWTIEIDTSTRNAVVRSSNDTVRTDGSQNSQRIFASSQPNPTEADVDVESTCVAVPSTSSTDPFILVARYADTSNFAGAGTYQASAAADKKIWENVSGTPAELASGDNGMAATDKLKFELRGTTWKLYQDTGAGYSEILSGTGSISAAGKAGVGWGNLFVAADDIDSRWNFDDYLLTEYAGGGGGGSTLQAMHLLGVGR